MTTPSPTAGPEPAPTRKPTVLFVDDNVELAENIAEILGDNGVEVRVAYDARSALAAFDESDWTLVVTDVRMPEIDGIDLVSILKQRRPSTPILVTTGFADTDTVERAHHSGAFAVVHKPVDLDELIELVHRIGRARKAVLIVEDDTAFCSNLVEILTEQQDILPHPAATLASARRLAEHIDFDMVVVDMRLPDGNGATLANELRHRPDGSLRPMILISGYAEEIQRAPQHESQICVLAKPFPLPRLIERVHELLSAPAS